jgi:hypothetical protein
MPPSTDQLSETERITKALKRFRPREAVKILAESSRGEEAAFLKTWALARLLAWAILDQRPGKRRPKKSKPTIRTANARLVGHLTLASLLDQRLKQYGARENDETLRLMLALFSAIGGFGVYVQGRGAKGLLSQAKKTNRKLGYVYRIVAYLCRYKQHIGDDRKFDIESAKYFVEKDEHEADTWHLSQISKIWEQYKQAAPYIFAFYRFFSSQLPRAKSPNQVIDFLDKVASNQRRLTRLIGRAAYAADILEKRARNVRLRDFKQIRRVTPALPDFRPEERQIIKSIDREAPIL